MAKKEQKPLNTLENVSSKLLKSEREVVIIFNEEVGVWEVEVSIPKFWRKFENKNWKCTRTIYYDDGTVCSKCFVGSNKGISITDPFKKRKMTEEQREAARQRFLNRK